MKQVKLLEILDDQYVDVYGIGEIVGLRPQTIHNLYSDGRLPVAPIGQVTYGGRPYVYLRSDVEAWAEARRKARP
jgi:predicted DNA-binding transcriptional regulator AlpA